MFSALASLLFLGAIASPPPLPPLPAPPGIEVLKIAAPSRIAGNIVMPKKLTASGMILVELKSGNIILSRHPNQRRPMASLTKIMTALVILESHDLHEIMSIPKIAETIGGSTIGVKTGEFFRIHDLLRALLIPSANDAAYALAIHNAGSAAVFVQKMNARAASLGLLNTHFTNPAGLDAAEQYSSPRDLVWLATAALRSSDFRKIVNTKYTSIETTTGQSFDLRNTNELLHENPHVFGVKTGTTNGAGECLIVLFEEAGEPYLLVLLGSKDRYTDSLYLLDAVHDAALRQ